MHIFYNGFMFSCLSRRQKESVNICSNLYEVKQQDIQHNFYKTAVRGGQQEKLMLLEQCGKLNTYFIGKPQYLDFPCMCKYVSVLCVCAHKYLFKI